MNFRFASRVNRIKPSATLTVATRAGELRAQGKDIIALGAGEPDFPTPPHIVEAAVEALRAGATKYTAVDGTPALKEAIIHKFERDNGITFAPDQIIASCGAKHALYNLLAVLIDVDDEVVIPAPYWVSYPDMVKLVDGLPVPVFAGPEQHFRITPRQLEAAITPKTKLLILNAPSNPTGMTYSRAEYEAMGEVLRRHPQVTIVSDEIYEPIYWGEEPFCNLINACPDLADRMVLLNGVSKAYAMTGWRIGYAAGPADLIKQMRKVQGQVTSNPTNVSQVASAVALKGDQSAVVEMAASYKKRHDFVVDALNNIGGVSCLPAQGTFYAFADMREAIERLDGVNDDVQLSAHFLDHGIAVVPGSAFGAKGYVRISYATAMDQLEIAMGRIADALK